ncbi:MAG: hypothetical protein IMF07_08880 [Proteobacteria bacterium]|nr:hypothetical protein [Pseudomonadota bacterium]
MNIKFKNISLGLAISLFSLAFFFSAAEIFARIYDRYADVPIHPKAERRDDDIPRLTGVRIAKEPGVRRILVLGDSIAAGQAIMKEETFSRRLEILINEGLIVKRYEVINTGFSGINTPEELNILLNRGPFPYTRPNLSREGYQGLAYKPDILILQYTVENDAPLMNASYEVAMPHRWAKDRARRYNFGNYALPLPENIDRWLTKKSHFYLFLLYKYHKLLTVMGLRSELNKIKMMYSPSAEGWQRTRQSMYRIGQIARSQNIPAVLVLWGTTNKTPLKDFYDLVSAYGRKSGFRVLNLVEDVKWPNEDFAVSMVDGHPNGRANKIAADAIFNFIINEKLVPR